MTTEKLDIEQFSPIKAECVALAVECKGFKIDGIKDKNGLEIVKEKQKLLLKKRQEVVSLGEKLRADSNAFSSAVREKQKELVEIIKKTEEELFAERDRIKELEEVERRKKILPERNKKLEELGIPMPEDAVLSFSDKRFSEIVSKRKQEILVEKEAEIKRREDEIEKKQEEIDDKIRADEEGEQRKKDIEERAQKLAAEKIEQQKIDSEREIQKKKDDADEEFKRKEDEIRGRELKIEEDKKASDEENRKDKEAAEKKIFDDAEAENKKKKEDREKQEKLEKRRTYDNFLKKNNFDEKIMMLKHIKDEYGDIVAVEIWTKPLKLATKKF